MSKKVLLIAILALLIYSCSDSVILPNNSTELSGYWINREVNDTIITVHRSSALVDEQYCFGLLSNGNFIERKNAGWCGTPPILYSDFEGTWSIQDSLIEISVPYWGGMANYTWKLVYFDGESFSFSVTKSEFEQTIEP